MKTQNKIFVPSVLSHRLAAARLLAFILLTLSAGLTGTSALPILSSNQLVFVNVDHAPMGACSTITYGFKGDVCGIGTQTGNYPFWAPNSRGGGGGGVLFGLSGTSGLQV